MATSPETRLSGSEEYGCRMRIGRPWVTVLSVAHGFACSRRSRPLADHRARIGRTYSIKSYPLDVNHSIYTHADTKPDANGRGDMLG